ncbi:hypothetical protein BDB01DRAFT_749405 [Pilobolus umbonatus]|nr:hypothetical protein BDB01DRAFT_749405 [Pilobolus umbonatus]
MSLSPELSPVEYDYSSDDKLNHSHALPTIKLKLKLNPYPHSSISSDDRRKRKHKKKHKKKHKRARLEGEEEEEEISHHIPVGGKRPFAMLNTAIPEDIKTEQEDFSHSFQSTFQEEEDRDDYESNDYDIDSTYHPTDINSVQPIMTTEDINSIKPSIETKPRTSNKGRRPSSKASIPPAEKPKKRGRPTNKAKAAAIALLQSKQPDTPRRDLKSILGRLLENIQKKDVYGFFLEPVNTKIVTDYLKIIKTPMDFSTMKTKLDKGFYSNVELFRNDFLLIITNAKTYNSPDTIYWKSADKIHDSGLRLIERAEKQVEEEMKLSQQNTDQSIIRKSSFPSRKLSISFTGRNKDFIKEEEVDIMGIDSSIPALRKQSRQGSESVREASVDFASSRALTPMKMTYKKKKKKVNDTGVLYGPDGSLQLVGGVSDITTLIPKHHPFSSQPQLTSTNPAALPSAYYLNRHSAEDWFHNRHIIHSANFRDFGSFTTLGLQPPGVFYTAQDASYIYPLYGDDRGEAYMRSIWDFVSDDDTVLKEKLDQKSNYLTRGAWDVVKQVLEKKYDTNNEKEYSPVITEFGEVEAANIVHKLVSKKTDPPSPTTASISPVST